MVIRIGLLSDVHYGIDTEYQKGTYAPSLLKGFVECMEEFNPQIIVELGDRINNISAEEDRIQLKTFRNALMALVCNFEYVIGNHDIAYLTKAENVQLVDQPMNSLRQKVHEGFSFFFLDSEESQSPQLDFSLMVGTKRTVFVFSHRPLLSVTLEKNRLFTPGVAQHCLWGEEFLQQLIEKGFYPICIHGHLHWNFCLVNDWVIQVCIPSLVDSWEVGKPAGSFGELIVDDANVYLDIKGLLPAHYCFQLKG